MGHLEPTVKYLDNMLPVSGLHVDSGNVRVDHRGIHLFMAEELTDINQWHTTLHDHSGGDVAEYMGNDGLLNLIGSPGGDFSNGLLNSRSGKPFAGLALRNEQEFAVIGASGKIGFDSHLCLGIDK